MSLLYYRHTETQILQLLIWFHSNMIWMKWPFQTHTWASRIILKKKEMIAPEEIGLKQSIYIALKVHQGWWSLVPLTLLWKPHRLLVQVCPIIWSKQSVIFKLFEKHRREKAANYTSEINILKASNQVI